MCHYEANRNRWAGYLMSPSPTITDWKRHVGSSSSLITIVVMTLLMQLLKLLPCYVLSCWSWWWWVCSAKTRSCWGQRRRRLLYSQVSNLRENANCMIVLFICLENGNFPRLWFDFYYVCVVNWLIDCKCRTSSNRLVDMMWGKFSLS